MSIPLRKGQAQSDTRKPRASSPGGLLEALEILRWTTQDDYFPRTSASPATNEARLAAGSSGRSARGSNFLLGAKFLIKHGNTWDFNPFYGCNNKLDDTVITEP